MFSDDKWILSLQELTDQQLTTAVSFKLMELSQILKSNPKNILAEISKIENILQILKTEIGKRKNAKLGSAKMQNDAAIFIQVLAFVLLLIFTRRFL